MPLPKLERRQHTYRIDPIVHRELKKAAFEQDVHVNILLENIIKQYLKSRNQEINRIPNNK